VSFRGSDLNPLYKSWRRNAADHWLRNAVGRRLSRYAAQRADGIVCVSEQLRQHLPLAARRRAIVIPSAVNLARFAPMPRNEARVRLDWALEDRVVLFNAGRFPALKRPELAIAAVERARASIPGLRMELLDGHLAPTEVPLYVNAANVVLLTSDFEGSPNIVKEAIACGVPVVSTRAGDVPERLADVRPSWVTSSTVNAIADALCAAVAFDGRTNGSEIAARDLDSLSLAQRLIAFYERVLRGIPDSIHEPSSDSPASVNSPAIVSRDA
jgi:glycosyltransferase involved in cell wall biosynthesis